MADPVQLFAPRPTNDIGAEGAQPPLEPLLRSFRLTLRAEGLKDKPLAIYTDAVLGLERFRVRLQMALITVMTAEHLREYFASMHGVNAPTTINQRFRSLQRFYRWLLEEGEIAENPMLRLRPPRIPLSGQRALWERGLAARPQGVRRSHLVFAA